MHCLASCGPKPGALISNSVVRQPVMLGPYLGDSLATVRCRASYSDTGQRGDQMSRLCFLDAPVAVRFGTGRRCVLVTLRMWLGASTSLGHDGLAVRSHARVGPPRVCRTRCRCRPLETRSCFGACCACPSGDALAVSGAQMTRCSCETFCEGCACVNRPTQFSE